MASTAAALKQLSADGTALTQAAAVLGRCSQLSVAVELAGIKDAVAAVDSAAAAGLLRLSTAGAETRLEFPLPVLRSAVYQHLGPALRSELHTAASRIMPLRCRAAPAPGCGRSAAGRRAVRGTGSGRRRLRRPGRVASGREAYTQAARLHPQPAARESLVIRTVDAMVGAGDLARALTALDTLDSFAPGPLSDAVRGYLAILRGRPAQADALLHKAWTAVDPATAPETAAGICQRQVLHALARFHGRDLVTWAERARPAGTAGQPGSRGGPGHRRPGAGRHGPHRRGAAAATGMRAAGRGRAPSACGWIWARAGWTWPWTTWNQARDTLAGAASH